MKKFIALGVCCVCAALPLCAGGKKDVEQKPQIVRVSALNGPSAVPMARLFEQHPELGGVESAFEVSASPDILLPKCSKAKLT